MPSCFPDVPDNSSQYRPTTAQQSVSSMSSQNDLEAVTKTEAICVKEEPKDVIVTVGEPINVVEASLVAPYPEIASQTPDFQWQQATLSSVSKLMRGPLTVVEAPLVIPLPNPEIAPQTPDFQWQHAVPFTANSKTKGASLRPILPKKNAETAIQTGCQQHDMTVTATQNTGISDGCDNVPNILKKNFRKQRIVCKADNQLSVGPSKISQRSIQSQSDYTCISKSDEQMPNTNRRHFSCIHCPETSEYKEDVEHHITMPPGGNGYVCLHCSYQSFDKYVVRCHVRVSHHRRLKPERRFPCRYCPSRFFNNIALCKHMEVIHKLRYVCRQCRTICKTAGAMERHAKKHEALPTQQRH